MQDMDVVATHVAPSLTVDTAMNDIYSAYNKPGAVLHWLEVTHLPYAACSSNPGDVV